MSNPSSPLGQMLYEYKGHPVYQYNLISIRLDEEEFKRIIDAQESTGLSKKKILAYSSLPCDCCRGIEVVAVKKYGKKVAIQRGILSTEPKNKKCNGI